jgi:hypothetical protein
MSESIIESSIIQIFIIDDLNLIFMNTFSPLRIGDFSNKWKQG